MTTPTQVTDEDRRAAASFYMDNMGGDPHVYGDILCGEKDDYVRPFAAHRLASERRAYENAAEDAQAIQDALHCAQFLLDRIDELEFHDDGWADFIRDWMGHVDPALARLKFAIRALATSEAPDTAPPSGR